MFNIDLSNNRAIVTGAASGIGAAIVASLRDAGAFVVGVDRNDTFLHEPDVAVVGDVTEERTRVRALDAVEGGAGDYTLVNNAAVQFEKRIPETSESEFRQLLEVNVITPWLFTQAFAARGFRGSVVNMASVLSETGDPALAAYTVSKGAIANFTRTAALTYAGQLRVNGVCPGAIRTPLTTRAWEGSGNAAKAEREQTALYPVGRIGEPEDVGGIVGFLASAHAGFVSGALWTVDGGLLAANAEWALERVGQPRQ